jgi:hypothetical protein
MDPPPALVAALQGIARGVPGHSHGGNIADAMESSAPIHAYTVPLTEDAEVAMAGVRREATALLRSHRGTYATALFGRYGENTAKLAMLAAISRDATRPVTEARDVTWGSRVVEHCIGTLLREAERLVGENDNEVRHKKTLNIIRAGGSEGITRTKLMEKTHFLGERREAVFLALQESGQISIEPKKGRTKSTLIYRCIAPEAAIGVGIADRDNRNPGMELSP